MSRLQIPHLSIYHRLACVLFLAGLAFLAPSAMLAQAPPAPAEANATSAAANTNSDLQLAERLIMARHNYQKSLEMLRNHYVRVGDVQRARWAEDELLQFHRIPKRAFRLELDVPPPNIEGHQNVPEANKLFTWAMTFKDKGWGTDYIDNQRRAEILFQDLLTKYPHSNKISDAAFMLGDIYESKAYRQYRRAAMYYERCYQWNGRTNHDARLRAARIYEKNLQEHGRATALYREILTHETDPARIQEANRRLGDIGSKR